MRKMRKNEDGFTGLEAAIVLIAFVVVAAVFSYVVLGAGFFTTQKSQQVVHAGVTQAASNIVVKGEVYGIANSAQTGIDYIRFDTGLAAGGIPIDMNRTSLVWSTGEWYVKTLTKLILRRVRSPLQRCREMTNGLLLTEGLIWEPMYYSLILYLPSMLTHRGH